MLLVSTKWGRLCSQYQFIISGWRGRLHRQYMHNFFFAEIPPWSDNHHGWFIVTGCLDRCSYIHGWGQLNITIIYWGRGSSCICSWDAVYYSLQWYIPATNDCKLVTYLDSIPVCSEMLLFEVVIINSSPLATISAAAMLHIVAVQAYSASNDLQLLTFLLSPFALTWLSCNCCSVQSWCYVISQGWSFDCFLYCWGLL